MLKALRSTLPPCKAKEISGLLTLAQTLNVRIAAVTPDACALLACCRYTFGAAMSGLAR